MAQANDKLNRLTYNHVFHIMVDSLRRLVSWKWCDLYGQHCNSRCPQLLSGRSPKPSIPTTCCRSRIARLPIMMKPIILGSASGNAGLKARNR